MRRSLQFGITIALVLASAPAFAHTPEAATRTSAWSWSSFITVPLLLAALMYLVGLVRMRRRGTKLQTLSVICFVSGWLSLFIALDSPLHNISEQLFWAHMTQHEILMLVSAPLVILGQPAVPFLFALPGSWRLPVANIGKLKSIERLWLFISSPLVAWTLHAAALWVWHAPRLFEATLESEWVHAGQHMSFFGTALLFWWTLLHKHAGRLGYGGAILYVFTTAVHSSVLGALLTFAPHAWYEPYTQTAPLWGLTAIQDQQLGGLIMWIPAGTLLTVIALVLLGKWIRHSDQRWEYTRTAALIRTSQGVME